jgi:hypothetical protein
MEDLSAKGGLWICVVRVLFFALLNSLVQKAADVGQMVTVWILFQSPADQKTPNRFIAEDTDPQTKLNTFAMVV